MRAFIIKHKQSCVKKTDNQNQHGIAIKPTNNHSYRFRKGKRGRDPNRPKLKHTKRFRPPLGHGITLQKRVDAPPIIHMIRWIKVVEEFILFVGGSTLDEECFKVFPVFQDAFDGTMDAVEGGGVCRYSNVDFEAGGFCACAVAVGWCGDDPFCPERKASFQVRRHVRMNYVHKYNVNKCSYAFSYSSHKIGGIVPNVWYKIHWNRII